MRNHEIVVAVDVNPRKAGGFVPGTGHRIVRARGAQRSWGSPIETVVVANRAYEAEVRSELRQLGLHPEVVAL